MRRGQLSLTAVEAALGVLLLLGVTFTFAVGVPAPATERAQLDAYASDTLTVVSASGPGHQGQTRLSELVSSPSAFEREKATLERRVERTLPENVLYRIETRHGTVGHPLPDDVPTGVATTTTRHGRVTLRVWYV